MRRHFGLPEIFLGALLAVAVFAMGSVFGFSFVEQRLSSLPPSNQEVAERNDKATKGATPTLTIAPPISAEDRIADYTWWLSAFTLGLAAVSSLQIFFLIRADKTARLMAQTAKVQTEKMGEWANIAEKQMLIAGQQTDIQLKQHAVGRLQFIADKRPRLHVRHVVVGIPLARDPEKITGSLVVVNQGGTEARILDSRCRIYWDSVGLPMDPPLYDAKSLPLHGPDDGPIVAGASIIYSIAATELLSDAYRHNIVSRGIKLYVMGYIRYADLDEKERFMGFCREYEPPAVSGGHSRFKRVDNEDYEYQD